MFKKPFNKRAGLLIVILNLVILCSCSTKFTRESIPADNKNYKIGSIVFKGVDKTAEVDQLMVDTVKKMSKRISDYYGINVDCSEFTSAAERLYDESHRIGSLTMTTYEWKSKSYDTTENKIDLKLILFYRSGSAVLAVAGNASLADNVFNTRCVVTAEGISNSKKIDGIVGTGTEFITFTADNKNKWSDDLCDICFKDHPEK